MDTREQIVTFIRSRGPVLPVQIAKEINSNILMASAHLSELVSSNKLKISNVKVGGSPLYYLLGQESRLQNFSSNLRDKEQEAYSLLGREKVLRDVDLAPAVRVALREIKDFAVPLQVNREGKTDIFWKWFMLPSLDAESLIKSKIEHLQKQEKQEAVEKEEPKPVLMHEEKPKKEIEKEAEEEKPEKKEPEKTQIPKEEPKKEAKKTEAAAKKLADIFLSKISLYFAKNNIKVVEQSIVRKNAEMDFIIKVPSSVGALMYYCKAKNKRSINDGDLSSTYIQSQSKKLPVLFLTAGRLTKKANEMLEKEFKGMNLIQI